MLAYLSFFEFSSSTVVLYSQKCAKLIPMLCLSAVLQHHRRNQTLDGQSKASYLLTCLAFLSCLICVQNVWLLSSTDTGSFYWFFHRARTLRQAHYMNQRTKLTTRCCDAGKWKCEWLVTKQILFSIIWEQRYFSKYFSNLIKRMFDSIYEERKKSKW